MGIDRIVLAGIQSGSGKTTVATGVMAALAKDRVVQPFKVGPDYIDPTYHTWAASRRCRNLDTWMVHPAAVIELFNRANAGADIAVIEGVMGLFDGRTGGGDTGSTASIAKLLGAPIVLVLDVARVARSAAAIVRGFDHFDPDVRLAGVILNRVASQSHYDAVAGPIEAEAGVPVLGYLPRDVALELPERYLGLIPAIEGRFAAERLDHLRIACEQTIDFPRLERIAAANGSASQGRGELSNGVAERAASLFPESPPQQSVRVAVARDEAFHFYYEDSLDLLRAWGAEVAEFSPLYDHTLPERCAAVYLGGGFPELYAAQLAENSAMHASLRTGAAAGMPIYAECGGLMYAGEELEDADGRHHQMVGLVPARSSMIGGKLSLGYRELRSLADTPLVRRGTALRAHEFHYSSVEPSLAGKDSAYEVGDSGRLEGYRRGSVLASYMHVHFAAEPSIAPRFAETARRWQEDVSR